MINYKRLALMYLTGQIRPMDMARFFHIIFLLGILPEDTNAEPVNSIADFNYLLIMSVMDQWHTEYSYDDVAKTTHLSIRTVASAVQTNRITKKTPNYPTWIHKMAGELIAIYRFEESMVRFNSG